MCWSLFLWIHGEVIKACYQNWILDNLDERIQVGILVQRDPARTSNSPFGCLQLTSHFPTHPPPPEQKGARKKREEVIRLSWASHQELRDHSIGPVGPGCISAWGCPSLSSTLHVAPSQKVFRLVTLHVAMLLWKTQTNIHPSGNTLVKSKEVWDLWNPNHVF